jgi:transposase
MKPCKCLVPNDHPLRRLRVLVVTILGNMSGLFDACYSYTGRPSIPPEHLLRALLLQILFTIRSERLLMEQLDYNLLFRWFVCLGQPQEPCAKGWGRPCPSAWPKP